MLGCLETLRPGPGKQRVVPVLRIGELLYQHRVVALRLVHIRCLLLVMEEKADDREQQNNNEQVLHSEKLPHARRIRDRFFPPSGCGLGTGAAEELSLIHIYEPEIPQQYHADDG